MLTVPWETWVGIPIIWPGPDPLNTYLLLFMTLLESPEAAPCHNQALNPDISMSSSESGKPRSPRWVVQPMVPGRTEAVVLL